MHIDDEFYLTGHSAIDADHRKLVALLTTWLALLEGNGSIGELHEGLLELMQHTTEHFRHEEELMRLHAYPQHQIHMNDHQVLVKDLIRVADDLLLGNFKGSEGAIGNYVRFWLFQHIEKSDRALAAYLLSVGV